MDRLCFIIHSHNKKKRHLTAISLKVKTTYVALVVRSERSPRVHKYNFEAKKKKGVSGSMGSDPLRLEDRVTSNKQANF